MQTDTVQVQSLGQVEPFKVGARSGIAFAMAAGQWRGASAAIAARLISDLPEAGASPVLNRLAASVLMSPSVPPAGGAGDMALAGLRLGSLYRMGRLAAVIDLAERSPGGLSDPENAAIATRAFLALGQDKAACNTANRLRKGRGAVYWLKVRAFCQARLDHGAAAQLSADLAMEADPEDTDFMLALNRMLNKDTAPVAPVHALELAMARFAGAPVQAADAPLALQSALVTAPGADGVAAARKLALTGLLRPQAMARLYLAWPEAEPAPEAETASAPEKSTADATPEAGTDASAKAPAPAPEGDKGAAVLARALAAKGDARAALFYQSAVQAQSDAVRADAIAAGLRHEPRFAGFVLAARLYRPLLQTLPPDSVEAPERRTLFAFALLAAGHPAQARAFAAPDDAGMTRLLALFSKRPLTAMGGLENDNNNQDKAHVAAMEQAYIDLMALNALHKPLQAAHRAFLFAHRIDVRDFAPCQPGARTAIASGAVARERAATLLRAALMLADSGFDQAAPECSAAVIDALQRLGFRRAARQAALEAMLGPRWRRINHGHE